MDASQKVEPRSATASGLMELATKGAVAFVALAYVFGLLIVNLRLQLYDVQAVGLVRVQYVMAGSLFLAFVALGVLAGAISAHVLSSSREFWAERRRGNALLGITLALSLPLVLLGGLLVQLSGFKLYLNEWRFWAALATTLILTLASWNLALGGHLVSVGWRLGKDFRYSQLHSMTADLSAFLTCLVLYAFAVYPAIEPAYGGGRPLIAQIVLTADAPPELRQILDAVRGKRPQGDYSILADTGDYLVIEDRRERFGALAIRKDMVVALATKHRR